MNRYLTLAGFLVLVLGGGLLIGFFVQPDEWYASLAKPPFNPPNWLFGPVWSLLYVMIAVAGWRVWQEEPKGRPMKLWIGQLIANFLWTPVFFGLHATGLALIVILVVLCFVILFIGSAWHRHRLAAWLFVPYAAWVAFATLLNASIWWLN